MGTDGGSHSSLGFVICQKSHLCFVMYCGDRQGSLLIRVCHLSKITFMFCHVLWGQTGGSLLIRVSFVKNHIYVFSCIVGTDGVHSSLGCVICQKSHLCFLMYCGDRQGSLLIRVCHLSKITFMFSHVLWGQTGGVTPH